MTRTLGCDSGRHQRTRAGRAWLQSVFCHHLHPLKCPTSRPPPPQRCSGSFVPPFRQQKVLFLAHPCLIVHPSIYKYVNMSSGGGGGITQPACIHRGGGSERPPPPKTVFLDDFNEYRMFIVTIPCDLHKRLENSTSILAALRPPPLSPDPSKHC